ncbi:WD repeat-containing protein 76 isoform X2 [Podarcis raffonei]|uniref:WD repeat-containing protein 76 isoform X2 n=1 Tax=Podarcis raffonei TaxID=65483 RepID=UPI002329466F|nr:WD repeat-containing protein 76 isoform X2 [Podarcis raffonei]
MSEPAGMETERIVVEEEKEAVALIQQREQETTPTENATTCLPRSPVKSKTLTKQIRILLTPVSATCGEHNKHLPQKRLLEQFSSCEESFGKEPKAKKICSDYSSPETRAISHGVSEVVSNTDSHRCGSVVEAVSSDLETDGDSESDRNDEEVSTQLSAYERKRLKNITENAKFFASLKLFESAASLRNMTARVQSPKIQRIKHSKAKTETTCRRSMRLQKVDPLSIPLPEAQAQPEPSVDEYVKPKVIETPTCNLESYQAHLHKMVLREDCVAKVVRNRIHSVAIHPSESRTLVAAGDKWGQIGLWDLDSGLEDGVHTFVPHSQPVSCMYFSLSNPAHLLSVSHDGTLRRGDVTRAVFDEVYRNEEDNLSSFDFLAADASTLIVGTWDGEVAVVDQRTPGVSAELFVELNSKKTRTIHTNPLSRHYFVAAGAGDVAIYDVRHLKASGSKPVVSLAGHTKSVASAYFSPVTGNRVLTTCADDTLRIFETTCISSSVPVLTTIRHNNYTGRWLTRFRAIWDPKRDDCFVVGSMSRPRQIEAFHATGDLVHSFLSEVYLGSVCSINAWHPTRYILAGGNSSGRLHVFKE